MSKRRRSEDQVSSYFHVKPDQKFKTVLNFFRSSPISILEGAPGTGKDYMSLYFALDELKNRSVSKILLCKPAVEVGRSIGFLKGDEKEKTELYFESFMDNLRKLVGSSETNSLIAGRKIEFKILQYVRGNTFDDAIVILSEAQNCNLHELVSFTTRIADSCRLLMNGDVLQSDIHDSGLAKFIELFGSLGCIERMMLDDTYQNRSKYIIEINKIYASYLANNSR